MSKTPESPQSDTRQQPQKQGQEGSDQQPQDGFDILAKLTEALSDNNGDD